MPRTQRRESVTGFYHLTTRGAGRRIIFEDDKDRLRFLAGLQRCTRASSIEVNAWCLMRNHAHLLLKGGHDDISSTMQRFETGYAHYFNGRHGHVGPVFQGRYGCEPIDAEEHLLMTLCYIHQNPMRAGESKGYEYRWSSFGEYLGTSRIGICSTTFILDLLGGRENFKRFHESETGLARVSLAPGHNRLADADAEAIAKRLFGSRFATSVALLPKNRRDAAIRQLRSYDLSIRQIERLTGIGRNIISRA